MALTTPHAWSAGDDATSTNLQTVTDAVTQLQGGTPSVSGTPLDFFIGYRSATQSISSGSATAVDLTATDLIDCAGGHDPTSNPSRYVGKVAGWLRVTYTVGFAANATGRRLIDIRLNGSGLATVGASACDNDPSGTQTCILTVTATVPVNGSTDYVEVYATQTSGGALNVASARAEVQWVHVP